MPTFDILRREADVRSFKQCETIFKEGDPADCMFVVVEGAVEWPRRRRCRTHCPYVQAFLHGVISEQRLALPHALFDGINCRLYLGRLPSLGFGVEHLTQFYTAG